MLLSFRKRLVEEQRKDLKLSKIITALELESADVHGEREALPEELPQDSHHGARRRRMRKRKMLQTLSSTRFYRCDKACAEAH